MSLPSLASTLRATSFRLTLVYAGLFTGALVVLLLAGGFLTMLWIESDLEAQVAAERASLEAAFGDGGRAALIEAIEALDDDEEPRLFAGLRSDTGEPIAGHLAEARAADGWYDLPAPDDPIDDFVFATSAQLDDGSRLIVGIEADPYYDRLELVLVGTAWVVAAALPLAIFCGWLISGMVLRRIAQITRTAAAIAGDGKLDRRIALQGTGDEFDELAIQLNAMLAGIDDLTQNIQTVSAGIAHDLRTPLTRLRNRLEALEADPETTRSQGSAIASMMAELDGLLGVFEALLRIAQIDSGTRRATFVAVDLSALVEGLAETYRPVAVEADKRLHSDIAAGVRVTGDPSLLTQLIVNLIENAIEHTPPGATIGLQLIDGASGAVLRVTDDGPGIAAADRERAFERFYRADRSRSSKGHGLGLALVRAIAKLHAIDISLRDAAPGLAVDLRFAHGHE